MTSAKIPKGPDELTNSWLTEALRQGGTVIRAAVSAHSIEPVAVRIIGGATVARVTLDYDVREDGAPRCLVAKFARTRGMAQSMEVLEPPTGVVEASFYRHLGADPGIPVPGCYYAEADAQSGAFVLLLEDMSDCRVGFFDGRPEDVELAVRHLAAFHARWWNSELLGGMPWLLPLHSETPGAKQVRSLFRGELAAALPRLREVFGQRLPETVDAIAERLGNHDDAGLADGPLTLVHGDYHPAQMFFPSERAGRFAVFDWEVAHIGHGGEDLARIIALGLTTEQRKDCEDRLVQLYHAVLSEHGVTGYELERCWLDFRRGLLYSVMLNAIAGAHIGASISEEAGADAVDFFVDILFGRLDAALRAHDVLDLLPG